MVSAKCFVWTEWLSADFSKLNYVLMLDPIARYIKHTYACCWDLAPLFLPFQSSFALVKKAACCNFCGVSFLIICANFYDKIVPVFLHELGNIICSKHFYMCWAGLFPIHTSYLHLGISNICWTLQNHTYQLVLFVSLEIFTAWVVPWLQ